MILFASAGIENEIGQEEMAFLTYDMCRDVDAILDSHLPGWRRK